MTDKDKNFDVALASVVKVTNAIRPFADLSESDVIGGFCVSALCGRGCCGESGEYMPDDEMDHLLKWASDLHRECNLFLQVLRGFCQVSHDGDEIKFGLPRNEPDATRQMRAAINKECYGDGSHSAICYLDLENDD